MITEIRDCPFAIFDMDGTLLDSMKKWKSLGRDYLCSLGIHPPDDLEERVASMSMQEGAEYLHRELKVPGDWKKIVGDLNGMMEEAYRRTLPLKPGVRSYLERLREKRTKMCVLTATPSYLAKMALERLKILEYFEFVMDCETAGSKKTRPECFLAASEKLGGAPQQTAVYEDADFALETARTAGFYTIGIYDETMAARRAYLESICDVYLEGYEDFLK